MKAVNKTTSEVLVNTTSGTVESLTAKKLQMVWSAAQWKQIFDSDTFEQDWCYMEDDLGANYTKEGTLFKVWAPSAKRVALNIYRTGHEDEIPQHIYEMTAEDKGVYSVYVPGDLDGVYYTYTIEANGEINETSDIYAKACGANSRRSMVIDLTRTNPENWDKDIYRAHIDVPVIYELHIKDFSNDRHCGIKPEYRGKYKAFTQSESVLDTHTEFSTGVDYLKQLGITHVHLLPAFDFGSINEITQGDEDFNWGYDPVTYNVPEGSYATDATDGAVRIREFKEMVAALHQAGISVVMDVVYNHTYKADDAFHMTVPYYYHREDENGELTNGSCCGNDTASDRQMYRNFMIQSVCYWAKEYHIDGFRFDLMGLHDTKTMNDIRTALNALENGDQIMVYGEPWTAAPTCMKLGHISAVKANVAELMEGISIFNDDTRDAIKGSVFFEDEGGYINGHPEKSEDVRSGVLAWCDGRGGYAPGYTGRSIAYVSAHDNFTLWDKLVYTCGDGIHFNTCDSELLQRNKMAAGIVFTCLGKVFIHAGEEFARTKQGIGDSYNKAASINQLDWNRTFENRDLLAYYQGLIALRKAFHSFKDCPEITSDIVEFVPQSKMNMVAFMMHGQKNEDVWQNLYIIYNPYGTKQLVTLPKGQWCMISNGVGFADEPEIYDSETSLGIMPYSVTILGKPVA